MLVYWKVIHNTDPQFTINYSNHLLSWSILLEKRQISVSHHPRLRSAFGLAKVEKC
jgi:hypothetical protein